MAQSTSTIDHSLEELTERQMLNELIFWRCHTFRKGWYSMNCTLCGWGFHEVVHNGEVSDW